MLLESPIFQRFIEQQRAEYGGRWEVSEDLWAVFAVPADDLARRQIAEELLAEAPFPSYPGESEDSTWALYYVETAHRQAAIDWLDELHRALRGEVKPVSADTAALVNALMESGMPHRVTTQLVNLHKEEVLTAGALDDRATVRGLLDRLHNREPLYLNAFQALLQGHLFDLVMLKACLIDEDVQLLNQLTQGSLSQDPFDNNRQATAGKIRQLLIRFGLINPLDQQRNREIGNPYSLLTDVTATADEVEFRLDGAARTTRLENFAEAVRALRRTHYLGADVTAAATRSPWSQNDTGYPIRAIKQRISLHADFSPLEWLYFFERSLVPGT